MSSKTPKASKAPQPVAEVADEAFFSTLKSFEGLKLKRQQRWKLGILVMALDVLSMITAYSVASLIYLQTIDFDQLGRSLVSLMPIFLLLNIGGNAYTVELISERLKSAWRTCSSLVLASMIMFLLFFFLKISEEFSRAVLALGTLMALGLLSVCRVAAAGLAERTFDSRPFATICIYDGVIPKNPGGEGVVLASDIGLRPTTKDPRMLERLGRLVAGADSVVLHCEVERRADWAFMLKSLDIATEISAPELTHLRPLGIRNRSSHTSLVLGGGQLFLSQRLLKRSFDLILTIAILPVLAPALVLIVIAVKLDSSGPALFRQDRIGLANQKFKILKFRTMRIDMQDDAALKATSRTDPRVTRVGQFLRSTSLDELPQFINVLMGDMSIVGPRPHAELTAIGSTLLWEIDAAYWHRHVVKPGITGLAQVRGHRGSLFEQQHLRDRLNADLEYAADWSLVGDIKIILQTANVLIHKNAF
jgi:lipopolysaccharide/colanic/teichoic acid biosynthesis glycosyltransferase